MKVFYCVIPYQMQPKTYRYAPVGNRALGLEMDISFPILAAIAGYVSPGEEFRIIAAARQTDRGQENQTLFREQLDRLCQEKGLRRPSIETVKLPIGEGVAQQAATFQGLIAFARDDDEIFACMTYGSKPLTTALMLAIQYSYRIKRNTSITCVVYGEVNWAKDDGESCPAKVYDMTALVQIDELVRRLADRNVTDPKGAIDAVLGLENGAGHG